MEKYINNYKTMIPDRSGTIQQFQIVQVRSTLDDILEKVKDITP